MMMVMRGFQSNGGNLNAIHPFQFSSALARMFFHVHNYTMQMLGEKWNDELNGQEGSRHRWISTNNEAGSGRYRVNVLKCVLNRNIPSSIHVELWLSSTTRPWHFWFWFKTGFTSFDNGVKFGEYRLCGRNCKSAQSLTHPSNGIGGSPEQWQENQQRPLARRNRQIGIGTDRSAGRKVLPKVISTPDFESQYAWINLTISDSL